MDNASQLPSDSSPQSLIKIDPDLEMRFLLYTISGCIVLVVSFITALVFTCTKEFRTKYALFNALAYADFINGLSFVMAGVYRNRYMHQGQYFITVTNSQCIWGTPWAVLMIVAGQLPAFLNLSLSLERVVALEFSSWYRRVWREHFKHYLVIASVLITAVLFIGVLFLDKVHTVVNPNRICAVMNSTGIIFGTIHYSVCALIFLACFIMLVSIFNKTNKRKKPSKDEHRRQLMLKYLTLVSVVLVSIPNLVLILNEWKLPAMNALLVGILYCMYAMHSAMSLPIYLFFRPDFRARFVQLFFRKELKETSDPITVTVGVKQTASNVSSLRMAAQVVTNWRAIIITGILNFFVGIESAFVGTSEWPYMHTIDKEATYSFFGLSVSISNWGNVGCSLLFAFWTYKFKTVRWPLLAGRILAFLGSCLYVCVEVFPTNRRYVMLACYVVFSIAKSSSVVLRAYMVMMSSNSDRSRAFALTSLSVMLSIVIGPLVQLAFSGIHYPGYQILPSISFNPFSAPIWLATITNFATILVVFFGLPEIPKQSSSKKDELQLSPIEFIKNRWRKVRSLEVAWLLVAVVLLCRLLIAIALGTVSSVITPIFMTSFGWDNVATVRWISISMGIVGVLSIGVALLFTIGPISRLVASRTQLLIAFSTAIIMYIASFPYPFLSTSMPAANLTTATGCNPLEFSWCDSARAPLPYIFIPVVLLAVGIALPTANISMDTMFSKVVGDANQSLMQCLVVFIDDITGIFSPLYSSQVFSAAGMSLLWICNGIISIVGTAIWIIFYWKMKKY